MTRKAVGQNPSLHALGKVAEYPLLNALMGRRSRRVGKGAVIDAGPFQYKSREPVQPLSDLERTLIVTTMCGNTGWSHLIPSNKKYAPYMPNYAGSASARTFPSSAGFHTTDLFFTDDSGVYFLSTRDLKPSTHNQLSRDMDLNEWLKYTEKQIRKISDKRLVIPREEPHIESHNLWVTNTPGSLFVIPVADLAQHVILGLCYFLQNGYGLIDDINKREIPGLEKFGHMIDLKNLLPITFVDQYCITEATVEISTSCFSASLLLQAMGLGGWMYDGVNPISVHEALGFREDKNEKWNFPNPTGLEGVFETFTPPHVKDMREAVEKVVLRKYGKGGPFHPDTPGAWKDTAKIRTSAAPHPEEFIECVALQCQYIFDTFGKFPATIPSAYSLMYLQAFHLDLDFYDKFYKEGAYLDTHASHDHDWH